MQIKRHRFKNLVRSLGTICASIIFFSSLSWAQSIGEGLIQDVLRNGNQLQQAAGINLLHNSSRAEYEIVKNVATETHTEIVPKYTETSVTFVLKVDPVALANPKMLLKDLALINSFLTIRSYRNNEKSPLSGFTFYPNSYIHSNLQISHSLAELIGNARQGSPTAISLWNELQMNLFEKMEPNSALKTKYALDETSLVEIFEKLRDKNASLKQVAIRHQRNQAKKLNQWKVESKALETLESQTLKLNDLILNNDREGVAKLIETYLPWAQMEPIEVTSWKLWLEAIRHPHTSSDKTTVAFRGLSYDTDKVQRKATNQGEVLGFMSTVLTKNQGNYTRRLRSLGTNREKNGDRLFQSNHSSFKSVRMMDQFFAHASSPMASSFLSFTNNPVVTLSFIPESKGHHQSVSTPRGGLLAVKMDSRRLFPNLASVHGKEGELLAPLIVFPDEVVLYREGPISQGPDLSEFLKEVARKTGRPLQGSTFPFQSQSEYKKAGMLFAELIHQAAPTPRSCHSVFAF